MCTVIFYFMQTWDGMYKHIPSHVDFIIAP